MGDIIAGTVRAWLEYLEDHDWTCPEDTSRIRAAFKTLGKSSKQWPGPSLFLDALKPRTAPSLVPRGRRLSNDRICERGLEHIKEIFGEMRLTYEPKGNGNA